MKSLNGTGCGPGKTTEVEGLPYVDYEYFLEGFTASLHLG